MLKFIRFTAIIFIFTLFGSGGTAQQARDEEQVRIGTNLVSVNVKVTDNKGRNIMQLQKQQFEIYDNGVKQQISHFSTNDGPVTFGIVYDMHPTTSERTETVLCVLRQFTKGLRETGDYFIVVFNERGSLTLDFIPTAEQVATHIPIGQVKEPNSLYDAIYLATEKIRERQNLKRTLLVISDSVDHNSSHRFQDLRRHPGGFDVQIYAIGVDNLMSNYWSFSDLMLEKKTRTMSPDFVSSLDRAALEEITRSSGGTSYSLAIQSNLELFGICTQIASETRQQYTIGFYSMDSLAKDKWHKLKVRVKSLDGTSSGYSLSYREGYLLR